MPETTRGRGVKAWTIIYLKGVFMGVAGTIPGVSGGTIALITGIYDRLIHAIAAMDPAILRHVPGLHRPAGRERFLKELYAMDVPFLAVLGLGVASAVVVLAAVVHTALLLYPAPMNALFIGLIAASALVLYREVSITTMSTAGTALAAFLFAFLATGMTGAAGIGHSLPIIFVSGVIASATMILPGISGAAFLYLFGQYTFLTGVLSRFVGSFPAIGAGPEPLIVLVFLAGAGTGLITVARLISQAISRYPDETMAALISLMLGALRMPLATISRETQTLTPTILVTVGGAVLAGAALVLLLDHLTAYPPTEQG